MAKPPPIPTFTDLYQHTVGDRHWLGPFLAGHLTIEFMLRKLIGQYDAKLKEFAETLRHHQLIELNGDLDTITTDQKTVLIELNRMRNRLAHEISFNPTLGEMRVLWQKAATAFSDLTDGISQGLEEMDIEQNLDSLDSWVFSELFVQMAYDLHEAYVQLGGDREDF